MGVLVIAPNWPAPSELWLQRQVEMLGEHLVGFAALEPQDGPGRGPAPGTPLGDAGESLWRRIGRKLRLAAPRGRRERVARRLAAAIAQPNVSQALVHYADYAVRFADVLTRCGKPVFVHCHGYDIKWDIRSHKQPDSRRYDDDYPARVAALSERCTFIANSQHSRRRLEAAGVSSERVVVKPLGVPVMNALPTPAPVGANGVDVLFLGRLCDCKAPDLTIRAFDLACQRGLKGRLTIAGAGDLWEACRLLAARSAFADRIRFLGAVDAATGQRLRAAAHIFTAHNCTGPLTGEDESLGVGVLEAMAAGLPVVTGRSGGVCETVVDGETGVLVTPGDVDAHADALARLAQDAQLRERYGRAGWERVGEAFSLACERSALLHILGLRMETAGETRPTNNRRRTGRAGSTRHWRRPSAAG